MACISTAHALIIAGGAANTDGTGIYGFDTVGQAGQSSGVYLGNGWVLTARHSSATDFSLNGVLYPNVYSNPTSNPSAVISITNPSNAPYYPGQAADLILYRVGNASQAAPVATPISLPVATPAVSTSINMVGMGGWTPTLNINYWSVSPPTQPMSWTWNALKTPTSANVAGYSYDPSTIVTGVRRWGTNVTDNAFYDVFNNKYSQIPISGPNSTITYVNTSSFFGGFSTTTGLPTGGTPSEAAAYYGDSGGGAFTSSQLIGTTLYQDSLGGGLNGQPSNTFLFSPVNLTPVTASLVHRTTATYFADVSVYAAEILGDAGISEWTLDASASWTTATWGTYTYNTTSAPNAAASTANFLGAISAPRTITVGSSVTVGAINFNNSFAYTLSGAGTIILDNSFNAAAFPAEVNTFSGTHTISAVLMLHSDLAVTTATGGGLVISSNIATDATTRALTKAGGGTLTLSGSNAYTGGTTVSAGKLILGNLNALGTGGLTLNGGTTAINPGLSSSTTPFILSHLTLGGGTLDLTNNRLIIRSLTDITTTVRNAKIAGKFMTTTVTAPGSGLGTTVGYLKGSDYIALTGSSNFAGAPVGPNDIVARWTYAGDINLNGKVDSQDLLLMDNGYLQGFNGTTNIASWRDGDITGATPGSGPDGIVDYNDFARALAEMSGTQLSDQMVSQYSAAFGDSFVNAYLADIAAAPEPASLALVGLGGALLLRRRR